MQFETLKEYFYHITKVIWPDLKWFLDMNLQVTLEKATVREDL